MGQFRSIRVSHAAHSRLDVFHHRCAMTSATDCSCCDCRNGLVAGVRATAPPPTPVPTATPTPAPSPSSQAAQSFFFASAQTQTTRIDEEDDDDHEGSDGQEALRRREQLVAFYAAHDPSHLGKVDALLDNFSEQELKSALFKKYGQLPEGWGANK
jgi:hypothetical protein